MLEKNMFFEGQWSPKIMRLTYLRPRTVEEIALHLSIPVEPARMLVKMLHEAGMLRLKYRVQKKDGSIEDYFSFEPSLSGGFVFKDAA